MESEKSMGLGNSGLGSRIIDEKGMADIADIVRLGKVMKNEPMSRHTTFRTGGPALLFASPGSEEELAKLISYLRGEELVYTVIGNGSNLLVADSGFKGVVVQIGRGLSDVRIEGEEIYAQAGAMLSAIARQAMEESLTGMEPVSGIPGSLGGALSMNAGAYGGEICDVTSSVRVLLEDGNIRELDREQMAFGYRRSIVSAGNMIVLSARLLLKKGKKDEIFGRMEELRQKRCEKQPLDMPSAGSTFKRPEGYFAAALIDQAGLRGYRRGGAMVSDKHCGFVVNAHDASSEDIRELMRDLRAIVYEKSRVLLEPEVRMLGFEDRF